MPEKGYWGAYCIICKAEDCDKCSRTKMTYIPIGCDPIDDDDEIFEMENLIMGVVD